MAKQELQACIDAGAKPLGATPLGGKTTCGDRERLALLTGVLELSDGDAASAVTTLSATKPPRGLESVHGWYFGEAQSYAGQRALALKTLQKARKNAPAWLATRIDRRLAELYLEQNQPAKATAILDADPDVAGAPELLYTRALARQAAKLTALAHKDWKALALKFPAHPHGIVARERLIADGAWKLTFDEALTRAGGLLAAGAVNGCLEAVGELTPEKPDQKARVALLKGQALLTRAKPSGATQGGQGERDAEAKEQLAIAIEGPPSVAAQALTTLAKRSMRTGDNAGARATFQKLDTLYPNDSSADEAGYLAAWLAMNSGDFAAAVKDFSDFETRHADSKKRDEARWFRAFSLIR
ncbi:MAG: outer membrane protein assembly factor BamD, partial [Archangium sp.]|nr:outer membrane protein assembly factor BamD [Archangium sp.]